MNKIVPCLWFDSQAEEAAKFYTSVFKNSKLGKVSRYGKEGKEIHGQDAGKVMTVEFEINGQKFTALNGGPLFKFTEAISFQVTCKDQAEADYYWDKLSANGDPAAQVCGWLKDKYGLSWQIVPDFMEQMMGNGNQAAANRVMKALLQMKKLDFAALKRAYEGT
jgi:predicted 3-demethylubiquinone-9 3-methyltransferase (glyoxalase superfamily)